MLDGVIRWVLTPLSTIDPAFHVVERGDDARHGVVRQELVCEVAEIVVGREVELQPLQGYYYRVYYRIRVESSECI
jgi:hypothetical protein